VQGLHLWRARPQRRTPAARRATTATKIETKVHPRGGGGGGPSPRRVHTAPPPPEQSRLTTTQTLAVHPPPPKPATPTIPSAVDLSVGVRVRRSLIIVHTLDAIVFAPASSCVQQQSSELRVYVFNPFR